MVPVPAIEVKDRLGPGQPGCGQRFAVEPLGLRAVDLIERARRDAEAQAAQDILDGIVAPERAHGLAEDGVAAARVRIENDGAQAGHGFAQRIDKGVLVRETLAVDDKADKHLLRSLGMADIDMPAEGRWRAVSS